MFIVTRLAAGRTSTRRVQYIHTNTYIHDLVLRSGHRAWWTLFSSLWDRNNVKATLKPQVTHSLIVTRGISMVQDFCTVRYCRQYCFVNKLYKRANVAWNTYTCITFQGKAPSTSLYCTLCVAYTRIQQVRGHNSTYSVITAGWTLSPPPSVLTALATTHERCGIRIL